ncbi:hypothetical protein [uncultured Methanoregula sp.]|uniref:hypothetical protein n=1 Tax=uncultured Methanoregula sp. TaxID=1005933 RepID=UPI002AAB52B3|nr:hypothetical protein [uncultured Methanoregula sp.]
MYSSNPTQGPVMMIGIWVIQLLVAWLIFRDAKEQKMLAPVWVILAIIPMFGLLTDVLYLIIREIGAARRTGTP